ncbi:MAG: ABC transporter ATP-binding protein [Candidatus Eremiobacteraeota bacterium]|nr:ABC transporter ATP-binding protein [Candidatus Eremiobacteraeota bacterium]MBV8365337.1 ABC transporter ATP-binding protein [Candidatus Eremiobacteraeota bacterium]
MSVIFRTEGLSKYFDSLKAVDGVDFAVEEGTIHAIIGPNGAGKTTFFNMLTGNFAPTAGKIIFRDEDITGLPPHIITRKGIGRSFQISNIFGGLSVYENVRVAVQATYGDAPGILVRPKWLDEVDEKAQEIIERVGLTQFSRVQAATLSHGDEKRLEIGLVIAANPTLLLFDEPTAGMSLDESHQTMDMLQDLAKRHTIVLIEHDMDLVMSLSKQITVLQNGRKIAEGSPAEIRGNALVQQAYLGTAI